MHSPLIIGITTRSHTCGSVLHAGTQYTVRDGEDAGTVFNMYVYIPVPHTCRYIRKSMYEGGDVALYQQFLCPTASYPAGN